MEKVSAIITTHNRSGLLKRAIESVLNQTYKELECIVVDDNSTDNTREVCSKYPVKYLYIPEKESHGGNYARNLGISNSVGDYCAFLDDDDYWLPTKIEKQIILLHEKKCECVYCKRFFEYYKKKQSIKKVIEKETSLLEGDISKKIIRHPITSTSCIIVSKKVLEDIGGFDENIFKLQEYELMIRIAQKTEIYYYKSEPLVSFTMDEEDGNKISNDPSRLPIAKKYLEKKHCSLIKDAGIVDRFIHNDWMLINLFSAALKKHSWKQALIIAPYLMLFHPLRFCKLMLNKIVKVR